MIGALSSGTPCLLLGWTHKYAGFLEFHPQGQELLVPEATLAAIAGRVRWISSPGVHEKTCERLARGNRDITTRTEAM